MPPRRRTRTQWIAFHVGFVPPSASCSASHPLAHAQTTPPGPKPGSGGGPAAPYSVVRWNEDYSYLKDPDLRTDFFDAIKYIPLNDAGGGSFDGAAGGARGRATLEAI